MVKHRGIEVAVISQIDINRLPEFPKVADEITRESNAVSCYIPTCPGSQIWFEYAIDPPHPPNAAYYFRLSINESFITAWDCTEKYGYCGKMVYDLAQMESYQEYPKSSILRRGFKFSECESDDYVRNDDHNVIELRVYRIEHRRRLRGILQGSDDLPETFGGSLHLMNGGALEPRRPVRRYQYQLLDPVDMPYAIFRFYYRTYDFLYEAGLCTSLLSSANSSSSSSSFLSWHDARSTSNLSLVNRRSAIEDHDMVSGGEGQAGSVETPSSRQQLGAIISRLADSQSMDFTAEPYRCLGGLTRSLSITAKDSIEDLPSSVPRSPESVYASANDRGKEMRRMSRSGSPTPSPTRTAQKDSMVNLREISFNNSETTGPASTSAKDSPSRGAWAMIHRHSHYLP